MPRVSAASFERARRAPFPFRRARLHFFESDRERERDAGDFDMAMKVSLTGRIIKPILGNAIAQANSWSGGPLHDVDLQALDAAGLLIPSERYPSNSSAPTTQHGSLLTMYDAADIEAGDADAFAAAIQSARLARAA